MMSMPHYFHMFSKPKGIYLYFRQNAMPTAPDNYLHLTSTPKVI